MRFELYRVDITRSSGTVTGFVIATDENRAADIVTDHEIAAGRKHDTFTLERVDETLPADRRKGLDDMLETAPAGMASYCEPIGWIAHVVPAPKLQLFRVEEAEGDEHYVIAPNFDVAAAVYCESILPPEYEPRLFRIRDGMLGLKDKRGLSALLEFGPVGVVAWNEERGWSLI